MTRLLVCGEDQLSLLRIGRELAVRNLAYDQTKTSVKKDDLVRYDLVVIHSSWRLPHLIDFIVNLVREHEKPVVYLSGDPVIGAFRGIMDDPYFAFVDDRRIDAEFGIAVTLLLKAAKAIADIGAKARKAAERADLRRRMDQCKEMLAAAGMTEEEAHALILRTAMDRQMSKYAACALIMKEKYPEQD